MSLQEAADWLEVSRATIYRWVAAHRLTNVNYNSAKSRQKPRFDRAQVYALRPDKQP